jgi:hypothetical protein
VETRRAWVLNFDVEIELEDPARRAEPSPRAPSLVELARRAGPLIAPGDVVLKPDPTPGSAAGRAGRCWCPTPRALHTLAGAGAWLPPSPSFEILRRVNDRRFSAALGQTLPDATFADSLEAVAVAVERSGPSGRWLIKRPFGFAGRGRIAVPSGPLSEAARGFCSVTLNRGGGLQVEPLVERTADFSLHGHLDREGGLVIGRPVTQIVSRNGVWQASKLEGTELAPNEARDLEDSVTGAGRALAAAGYFGPFGVDAFRWRGAQSNFCARCEINARYTMSWALGMGSDRPDLDPSARPSTDQTG